MMYADFFYFLTKTVSSLRTFSPYEKLFSLIICLWYFICAFTCLMYIFAGPGGHAVLSVVLPFGYWGRGFESHSRHGCVSLCFCVVLSCVGRGLCDGLITCPKESC
jgi:hypothetical protein